MKPVMTIWLALTLGALLSGGSLVGLMVLRRPAEPAMWAGGVIGTLASLWGFLQMPYVYARADALLYALAFMLASFVGGYALASSALERLSRSTRRPNAPSNGSAATQAPAVIVFTCAEPQDYDPGSTAHLLQELVNEGLIELSLGTTPMMFLAQKARYRAAGGSSPSRAQLRDVAEHLQRVLGSAAVEVGVCSGEDALERKVSTVIAAGHRRIVVAELAVGESLHHAAAKKAVDMLRPTELDVEISYTGPLWDSERVTVMLVSRVMDLTTEPTETGVVLIGHGQPDERAHRNPTFDEHEAALLNRVRMALIDSGLSEDHVRVAWSEWRAPDATSAIRHLAALGCRRVIVVPGCFPLDSLATRLDLELAARQARVQDEVTVLTIGAWRDNEAVIEELRSRVQQALAPAARD